jgi:hypothetical protein
VVPGLATSHFAKDTTLTHYDQARWVDFVRGLIAGSERHAMQAHLDSGCRRCHPVVQRFRTLAEVTSGDSKWEAPEGVVQTAKAFFALQRPEKVHILPRVLARLVFDSFRDPLPAGVRMQHRLSRQALYEAGRYSVDVRLEHEKGSRRVTLLGQIGDREQPGQGLADVPVWLVSGKRVLARALSNTFGEFQMDYEPARRLRLYVPVEQRGKHIEVRLGGLTS